MPSASGNSITARAVIEEGRQSTAYFASDERDIESVVRRDGAYGGHHIGTVRMSASPTSGVVDQDCKVFGLNNLYVAGSATFPTSSQANPTLTIVALSLRLAKHLSRISNQISTVRTIGPPVMAG